MIGVPRLLPIVCDWNNNPRFSAGRVLLLLLLLRTVRQTAADCTSTLPPYKPSDATSFHPGFPQPRVPHVPGPLARACGSCTTYCTTPAVPRFAFCRFQLSVGPRTRGVL